MTYYFFHIKINTETNQGYVSGVMGFYDSEAPTPVEALEKIKDYVQEKFPLVERYNFEVTQFNNVAQ